MKHVEYKKSFGLFLKRTNEKDIIKRFIEKRIPFHKKMNFLDIGGGNGTLARAICKKVASVLVVEPNRDFCKQFNGSKIRVINSKWEKARINDSYDFILAAYVVTYFPQKLRRQLIEKIYKHLKKGGFALILSIDARKGSWRRIHTYFYKLIGFVHYSSDDELKKIIKKYKPIKYTFKTRVVARNAEEMLNILGFDFHKYPAEFNNFSEYLKQFMRKYIDNKGQVILEMIHNAYIINKA